MQLNRSISNLGLLFTAVGGIIGSGWLLGPFLAAKIAGPGSVLSWIIGGLMMMMIALTYAELSSMLPVAGGTVRFLQFSHGTFASFTIAWIAWLASASVAPIETLALLHYAAVYLPWLMHKVNDTLVLTWPGMGIAAVLMFVMCFVNIIGVKILTKTNIFVVILKLLVPFLTVLVLFGISFHLSNFTSQGFLPMGFKGVLSALPSAGVIFSFIGYSPAVQLAGEAKNPQKAIPFAILGALIICIFLYTPLQASFIGALNPQSFTQGWQSLNFAGDAGPFAGIATALGALWLAKILYLDAALSPFGTGLIYTGSTARMAFAMGKNGYLPKMLMKLNSFGVPIHIIILNYIIGLSLFLPFPTWQGMMSFLVSCLVLAYTVGPLALGVLRVSCADRDRPFKVPAYRIVTVLAFYFCNLIVYWTGWKIISSMLIAVVIGYILLFAYKLTTSRNNLDLNWKNGWWVIVYFLALGGLAYISPFGGGKNWIPFGWDFLAVGAVALGIYSLSQWKGIINIT